MEGGKKGMRLELSIEKTLITNTRKEKAKFLGVMINRRAGNHTSQNELGRKSRVAASTVVMTAPIPNLIDKLEKNRFIKLKNDKLIPQTVLDLTPLPMRDLILHYRSVLMGLMNYYSFVDNRPYLRKIYHLLRKRLIRTICHKNKLN